MAVLPPLQDHEVSADALAVFDDIRRVRNTDFINNFWRVLAHDPQQLRATWERLQSVMAPGALDPLVKEMIYIAVSTANGCSYCIHSHTAAAKAKGMSDAEHHELLAVIGMAAQTNAVVTGLQVPVDPRFKAEGQGIDPPPLQRIDEIVWVQRPASAAIAARDLRARSVADFS